VQCVFTHKLYIIENPYHFKATSMMQRRTSHGRRGRWHRYSVEKLVASKSNVHASRVEPVKIFMTRSV